MVVHVLVKLSITQTLKLVVFQVDNLIQLPKAPYLKAENENQQRWCHKPIDNYSMVHFNCSCKRCSTQPTCLNMCMMKEIGIDGKIALWISSFLKDRKQRFMENSLNLPLLKVGFHRGRFWAQSCSSYLLMT